MPLPKLPANYRCSCGAQHTCGIEAVLCAHGARAEVPGLLRAFARVAVVYDGNTGPLAGFELAGALEAGGHAVTRVFFDTREVLVPDEDALARVRAAAAGADVLAAVGSGVLNDLCKAAAFERGLPYLVLATAPSMDGYASAGAALLPGGMKVTVPCAPPRWVVGDTALLATAPLPMLQCGIGDLIAKYSCLNDWRLSALVNGEAYCPELAAGVKDCADACAADIEAILARDEAAVGRLFEGLAGVGVAMSLAGSSRPASGSEHHLAHFYEVTGLVRGTQYLPHGLDAAFGTLVTCGLREQLLALGGGAFAGLEAAAGAGAEAGAGISDAPGALPWDARAWRLGLGVVYGPLAKSVAETALGTGFYDPEARARRAGALLGHRAELAALLADCPRAADIAALLDRAKIDRKLFYATYGTRVIGESIVWARELKDRYTLLSALWDLGLLDAAAGAYIRENFG